MTDLWICIGSNVDDARQRIADGIEQLRAIVHDLNMCEPYATPTEPDDGAGRTYLNTVVHCRFDGCTDTLERQVKEIECRCGRTHGSDKVALDIDIVIIDDIVVRRRDFDRIYFKKGFESLSR